MRVLLLAVYLLWFVGGCAVIMAAIMGVTAATLRRRGRAASRWPRYACAQVHPEAGPLHLSGASAPGPAGLLRGRLSGQECVWYRDRVLRNYWVDRWRPSGEDSMKLVTEPEQEQVWAWESGPFALTDATGSVLMAPALLQRTANVLGHPRQQVLGETRDKGPEPGRYHSGALGALQAGGLLPPGLLDRYAEPAARTFGYRVIEEILRPDLSLHVFAVPGDRDGQPIMAAPVPDVPAISAQAPVPAGLIGGARRATRWATVLGGAGLACWAGSVLLLPAAGG